MPKRPFFYIVKQAYPNTTIEDAPERSFEIIINEVNADHIGLLQSLLEEYGFKKIGSSGGFASDTESCKFLFPASKKHSFVIDFQGFLNQREEAAPVSTTPAALFSPAENGDASKTKLNKDDKLMRKNVKAEIDKIMAAQAEARKKALSQQKEDASSDSEDPDDGFVMMPRSS